MKYLFSPSGRAKLREVLREPLLLAFDFDGTLATITTEPTAARLNPTNFQLLRALREFFPVAVLSGRSSTDLKKRLPTSLFAYVGNHGLEGLPGARSHQSKAKKTTAGWKESLRSALPAAGLGDVFLEDKKFSLALHYRTSRQRTRRRLQIRALAETLRPAPRLVPGKFVWNLVPPNFPHKGDALVALLQETGAKRALFIGDDETDEDVFRLGRSDFLTVRVGAKRKSKAAYFVRSQREVARLMRLLLKQPRPQ